ncbi:hypothetical protein DFP72DRAFT_1074299 [Ephemerocybe angulata]|uniref:Uncharacterized protein n=1 Tax=Ephemerocybe angulata TaxID=980116 RepID=A0A8H6HL44_9AGAR|nr:hypothetical protein DFP72DRAFT_1074299 [Tulosesus angulatus]
MSTDTPYTHDIPVDLPAGLSRDIEFLIGNSVEYLEGKMAKQDDRFDVLDARFTKIRSDINNVSKNMDSVSKHLEFVEAALDGRLKDTSQVVDSYSKRVERAQSSAEKASSQADSSYAEILTTSSRVSALSAKVSRLEKALKLALATEGNALSDRPSPTFCEDSASSMETLPSVSAPLSSGPDVAHSLMKQRTSPIQAETADYDDVSPTAQALCSSPDSTAKEKSAFERPPQASRAPEPFQPQEGDRNDLERTEVSLQAAPTNEDDPENDETRETRPEAALPNQAPSNSQDGDQGHLEPSTSVLSAQSGLYDSRTEPLVPHPPPQTGLIPIFQGQARFNFPRTLRAISFRPRKRYHVSPQANGTIANYEPQLVGGDRAIQLYWSRVLKRVYGIYQCIMCYVDSIPMSGYSVVTVVVAVAFAAAILIVHDKFAESIDWDSASAPHPRARRLDRTTVSL